MPYAFAHPAAAVPLARLLGRFGVPSALAIGAIVPDAWYVLPFLVRDDAHDPWGLATFCLPAGLLAYAAFHLHFKQPLAALLPHALQARLQRWLAPRLPALPWIAVLASLLAGSASHLAWDAFTHRGIVSDALPALEATLAAGPLELSVLQLLQHGSTLLGAAFLAWWCARRLRAEPPAPVHSPQLGRATHAALVAALLAIGALCFARALMGAGPDAADIEVLRRALRAGALSAALWTGALLFVYSMLWKLKQPQVIATRSRSGAAPRRKRRSRRS